MAKKIVKCHIKRKKGYLYFVDKEGDVSMAQMARGRQKGGKPTKVHACGITRQKGYLYFVDKQGDVSMAQMARGKKRKKKK